MKKIIFAMLFSVFLLSAMTVPSLSQDEWEVGVNVGDWFLYKGTLVEYEADEGVPFPPSVLVSYLYIWNESDWRRFTVTNVSGTIITWEIVTHWKNGTEVTETIDEDITFSDPHFAIGANMEPGDEILPALGPMPARIINETIDWEYANITRETNYMKTVIDPAGGLKSILEWWWDKATGIRVKYVDNSTGSVAQGNVTYLGMFELIHLNVWVIPEYPTWTVMLLVFVAVTVSIDLYIRKKLKH